MTQRSAGGGRLLWQVEGGMKTWEMKDSHELCFGELWLREEVV